MEKSSFRSALVLPQAARRDFFTNVIDSCRTEFRTIVVDAQSSHDHFRDLADKFIPFPDWTKLLLSPDDERILLDRVALIERQLNFSFSRIILAGERNIGAAYGQGHYDWPTTRGRRRVLSNNVLPYRILLAMIAWIERILETTRLDVIISGSSSSPVNLLFSVLSEARGVPYLICRSSKVLSNRTFITQDRLMLNDRLPSVYQALLEESEDSLRSGFDFVKQFRSKPKHVKYIKKNWDLARETGLIEHHRRFFVLAVMGISALLFKRQTLPPKPFFSTVGAFYRRFFRIHTQARFFSRMSSSTLKSQKYIYFPLHKEPELALNFLAYLWHDQRNTVARLSSVLPANYSLLVKEHPLNLGRRSNYFLRRLTSLPSVKLIHPDENSFNYVSNADLIVTENGSSGWEGLLLGRPVLCLDKTFYDELGLAHKLSFDTGLNQAVLNSINTVCDQHQYLRKLAAFVEAEFATTFSDNDPDIVQSISQSIEKRLIDPGPQY